MIELDLAKIKRLGEKHENENYKFRSYLKQLDPELVDAKAHELHHQITAQIDCTECGNCCNFLKPGVNDADILTLSNLEGLSPVEFEQKFVEHDDFDQEKFLKDTPCKYLKDKKCSIYAHRPEDCRSYPHTHKPEFASRTSGMISSYAICPIVFNLMEELKLELGFK